MKYEERIVKLCKECHEREQCGYVTRKLMGDCIYLQDVMSGWELGYQDAVEKALDWVKNRCTEREYKDFKKYMEE